LYDLVIETIEDKIIRRRLKILKFLYDYDQPIYINELVTSIGYKHKTIYNDIDWINDEYKHIIKIYDNKYFFLDISKDKYQDIIDDIYFNTISYRLFKSLYYDEQINIKKFADENNVSYVNFTRYLNYLNSLINKFNIGIYGPKLHIEGKEADIQYFYFNYLFTSNFSLFNNRTNLYYDIIMKIINIYLELGLSSLSIDYNYASYHLQVILERYQVGKYIDFEKEIIEEYNQRRSYNNFKNALYLYSKQNKLKIINNLDKNVNFVLAFYLLILDCVNYDVSDNNNTIMVRNDVDISEVMKYSILTKRVTSQICVKDREIFLNKVINNYLLNLNALSIVSPLYQLCNKKIKEELKNNQAIIYDLWYRNLQIFIKERRTLFFYLEDIATSLALLTTKYLIKELRKINIVAFISGEPLIKLYLRKELKALNLNNINLTIISNKLIDNEIIKQDNIDIIITNYQVNNVETIANNIMIFELSYLPNNREIKEILDYINCLDENRMINII
jgi:hypothetical protein